MRRPTLLELLDIALFAGVSWSTYTVNGWEVKLGDSFLPTVVNGITSVTGIMIGLCSVLIIFSMNQHGGLMFKRYRRHIIGSLISLMIASISLVSAYTDLIHSSLDTSVKLAYIGLGVSFFTVYEFLFFFAFRIAVDMRKTE